MASPILANRWITFSVLSAMAITFGSVLYWQNTSHRLMADEVVPISSHASPPLIAGTPANSQTVCISGIKLSNRPNGDEAHPQVLVDIEDRAPDSSTVEIPQAAIDAPGRLLLVVPGQKLHDTNTYRITIKPLGYVSQTISPATRILSQCITDSRPFQVGDFDNDNSITAKDIKLLEFGRQGQLNNELQAAYQNKLPTLRDLGEVIQASHP